MEDLKESTLLMSMNDLQRQWKEQGYLFFRSFFPISLIQEAREEVIQVLQSEGWGTVKKNTLIPTGSVRRINSLEFYRCITQLMKKEGFHDVSESSSLISLLSALLKEPVFSHPRKMIRMTYPYRLNPKDQVPPHQDLSQVKGEKETFTAWIPLGNYSLDCGGLLVAAGTHTQGLLPSCPNAEGRFRCQIVKEVSSRFVWAQGCYRMGDLLILHALTVHQSGINQSDTFRLSLDCRFSSVFGMLNEDQLLSPYYPHVPNWNVLSKQWKRQNRFSVPKTIQLHARNRDPRDSLKKRSILFGAVT